MLAQVHAMAERLKTQYGAKVVIIFGSFARGEAKADSDLDMFIVSETQERFYQRQATVRRLLRDLKKGIPLSPIVLTPAEVEQQTRRGDQFIQEIFATGIRA